MVSGILMKADGTVQLREVRDELDAWYTMLGCSLIETVQLYLRPSEHRFTVICDEEGLLNGNDTPMIFGREKGEPSEYPIIVGNVFICNTRGDEFADLTTQDASDVINAIRMVKREDGSLRPVIVGAHRFQH